MKNKKDYLTGRVVMVDSNAFTDQDQRPGQIGIITNASEADSGLVTVRFDDRKETDYPTRFLRTLSPAKMILDSIIYHQKRLNRIGDLKHMLLVYKLIAYKRISEALSLASKNNSSIFYCTMDCKNFQEIMLELRAFRKKVKRGNI